MIYTCKEHTRQPGDGLVMGKESIGPHVNNCSISSRNYFLTTFVLVLMFGLASGCRFPRYLDTGNSPWIAIYKNDRSFQGYFKGSMLKASKCDTANNCEIYTRKCIAKLTDEKFEVQHITKGSDHQYLCMQFIRRSPSIIQIKESLMSYHPHQSYCNDDRLNLDNWPLFTEKRFWEDKVPCPFVGGYDVRFSSSDSKQKCPNELISPRLESECEQGDGITIDFRQKDCLDEHLFMSIKQSLYCSATWKHDKYTFVILRPHKDEHSIKAWCLRYTQVDSKSEIENVHLFMDFVCDPGDGSGHARDTTNFLYLEMEHKIINSICADLSPACEEERLCVLEIGRNCPNRCKFCEGDPDPCTFPAQFQGHWVQYEDNAKKFVNISYYELNMSDAGRFQCYEEEDQEFENHTMLLQTFDNGCFPRFACLEINKPSASTLEYRLGNRVSWPLAKYKNLKPDVCSSKNFKPNYKDILRFGKHIGSKPSTVIIDFENHYPTFCGLDKEWFHDSQMYIKEKDHCDLCLVYDAVKQPMRITQLTLNCSKDEHTHVRKDYKCLDSVLSDESTHAFITRTLHTHEEYICWVFVQKDDVPEERGVIYILEASTCDSVVIESVKNGHITPKKVYTIPKFASNRSCPYTGQLISTSTTPETIMTTSQPKSISTKALEISSSEAQTTLLSSVWIFSFILTIIIRLS